LPVVAVSEQLALLRDQGTGEAQEAHCEIAGCDGNNRPVELLPDEAPYQRTADDLDETERRRSRACDRPERLH
jgi:hypothetical protein